MAYSSSLCSDELSPTTKLRRLRPIQRKKLVEILNFNDSWQELASVIPNPDDRNEYLYTSNDIDTFERQYKHGATPAESLLEHWSTSGKNQPTLTDLLSLLEEAQLFRAADYIRTDLMKNSTYSQNSQTITTESFTHNRRASDTLASHRVNNSNACSNIDVRSHRDPSHVVNEDMINVVSFNPELMNVYRYNDLVALTKGFKDKHVQQGGCKIGEGSYGSVYRAYVKGHWIAVKRLKEAIDKQFFTELNVLTKFKHENLLPLLGFSDDGPHCCLIYLYMKNGSLQERLACVDDTPDISWKTRISIACGSARGINHLHTFAEQPFVHRDIKSANILLDENYVPKVGDFGLVRSGSANTSSVVMTANVCGTSVYMAREAFNGDISVKLDTFSFGVVLLELLTGLPPYDSSREEKDLVSHIECCDNVLVLLDRNAGKWNTNIANRLYEIAKSCLEMRKKDRPTMTQVLGDLETIFDWGS